MLTDAYNFQPISSGISAITRARISASLTGRTHTQQTKALMSQLRTGAGNPYHGRSLDKKTLDAAVLATATPIYAYDVDTFTLVNEYHSRVYVRQRNIYLSVLLHYL